MVAQQDGRNALDILIDKYVLNSKPGGDVRYSDMALELSTFPQNCELRERCVHRDYILGVKYSSTASLKMPQ